MTIKIEKPEQVKPPYRLVVTDSGGGRTLLRLSGHKDAGDCHVEIENLDSKLESMSVIISVKDLLEAARHVQNLSGHVVMRTRERNPTRDSLHSKRGG